MNACRACGTRTLLRTVLDLGATPPADSFPPADSPVSGDEASYRCAMALCGNCGLAQLQDDDTVTAEPRGIEPQALVDQAGTAVSDADTAGWLTGGTVTEFGSPHGGTWLPRLAARGFEPAVPGAGADVVIDSFGIMHEPDQRAAFEERARAVATDGVLLLQFHSLGAIVRDGQWNALRHGHFAYYSLPVVAGLLASTGMRLADAWWYDLYGGTIMVAAVHAHRAPREDGLERLARVRSLEPRVTEPAAVSVLQDRLDAHIAGLRRWLRETHGAGRHVYAYGAASRAVSVFGLCRPESDLIAAVADASPAKQGRRMPGTRVPIISPSELVDSNPDRVILMLPDLWREVAAGLPELDGRWIVDGPGAYADSSRDGR